jgi:hypothetical protein
VPRYQRASERALQKEPKKRAEKKSLLLRNASQLLMRLVVQTVAKSEAVAKLFETASGTSSDYMHLTAPELSYPLAVLIYPVLKFMPALGCCSSSCP